MEIDPDVGTEFPNWVGDWALDYADRRPCTVNEAWLEALGRFAHLRKPAAAVIELSMDDDPAAASLPYAA